MARSEYITRTIIDSRTYQVIDMRTNTSVGTIQIKGKPKGKEIAKEFDIPYKQMFLKEVDCKKTTYAMPVTDFMVLAEKIK